MSKSLPFRDKHPFLVNSVLMIIALVVSVFVAMLFIDVFTSHGQEKLVPEVRNKSLEEAIKILEDAGLNWEIADSTNYNESFKPGVITDQEPQTGSYIKAIRPVYLYVNAMSPREVPFPKILNTSLSYAKTTLYDHGFKNIEVDTLPDIFGSKVVQVTVNGHQILPDTGVPINARIKVSVGNGKEDPAMVDSIRAAYRAANAEREAQKQASKPATPAQTPASQPAEQPDAEQQYLE